MKINEIPVGVLVNNHFYVWESGRIIVIIKQRTGSYWVNGTESDFLPLEKVLEIYGNCPVKLKLEVQEFFEGGE